MRSGAMRLLPSDLPEDLLGGGNGIQLPLVDLLHELVVLPLEALLHLPLETLLGPRDDELPERGSPPLFEPAALLQVSTVLLYGLFQLLDALAGVAARHDDGREPRLGVELLPDVQDGAHLARRTLRLRVVRLVYAEDVGDLHHPGLQGLHRVPRPWLQRQHHRVRGRRHLDLPLPYPDSLVEHHVHPGGLHREAREPRGTRQPPEVSPGPHRPDKHPAVEEVVGEPDAVPEDGAPGERARGVHRDDADPPVLCAVEFYELRHNAALPHPGRTREADAQRVARLRIDLGDYPVRLRFAPLYLGDHPRKGPPVAREHPLDETV